MGCATHAYKNGCEHHDLGQPIQRSVSVASRVARLSYGLDPGAASPVRQLVTKVRPNNTTQLALPASANCILN